MAAHLIPRQIRTTPTLRVCRLHPGVLLPPASGWHRGGCVLPCRWLQALLWGQPHAPQPSAPQSSGTRARAPCPLPVAADAARQPPGSRLLLGVCRWLNLAPCGLKASRRRGGCCPVPRSRAPHLLVQAGTITGPRHTLPS